MKFSIFIHPPNPAPRRITGLPSLSTIFSPETRRKPFDMVGCGSLIFGLRICEQYQLEIEVRNSVGVGEKAHGAPERP